MKHQNNLPEAYIKDAIHNPLLFQEHNPLISESMSLLNSRMKKSFDLEMQQFTSKELSKGSARRGKQMKESEQMYNDENYEVREEEQDEMDNSRAIKEFERQIEEKFKISVANKLYTFPRLKITSIMDIISSSQSQDDEQPASQPSSSQQVSSQNPSNEYNPFDPVNYQKRMKTEYLGNEEIEEQSNEDQADRNFKKVKLQNVKVSEGKKTKDRKNESLKKEDHPNYSHREKVNKHPHKHLQGQIKQKPKQKANVKGQKQTSTSNHPFTTIDKKQHQPWAVKQPHQKHNIQRLKTQMCNDSSRQSQSITQSKRRYYEEEFFIRK